MTPGARQWTGYVFLLPYLTLFLVFMILPLGYGLTLSFQKYEMLTREPPRFIGLDNYRAEAEGVNVERVIARLIETVKESAK